MGEQLLIAYCAVSFVTVGALTIAWAESGRDEKPIWPIVGTLWPILAVIGIWKLWSGK